MSAADRLACEDVVMFVNAAVTATSQREFRQGAADQRLSVDFLHRYVLGNYREVYAPTLALDVNDHNAAQIALNLLRTTRDATAGQRRAEGQLVARRLELLPPQRALALFRDLRRHRVNNRRTRTIMREWLAARPDPTFDAVKYRGAVRAAVRHAHLPQSDELATFLFAPQRAARYTAPLLEQWSYT